MKVSIKNRIVELFGSRILTLIAVTILLFISASFIASMILQARVRKELASIKNAGAPLILKDMSPAEPERGRNAAILYTAAMDLVDYNPAYFPEKQDEISAFYRKSRDEMPAILSRNAITLQILDEAKNRPACRYDLRYEDGYRMRILDLKKVKEIVRLSAMKAMYEIDNRQPEKASETVATALRFLRTLEPEIVLTQVVRAKFRNMLEAPLKALADSGFREYPSSLKKEISEITAGSSRELEKAILGERAIGIQVFDETRRNGTADMLVDEASAAHLKWNLALETQLPGKPILYYDELKFLENWNKVITAVRKGETPPSIKPGELFTTLTWMMLPNCRKMAENNEKTRQIYVEIEKKL
jgi:hypothetical protein